MRKSRDPEPGSPQPAADDMQKIAGIGPALATRLAEAGVSRYRDLASFTQERLGAVVHVSPERIAGQDWIGQARRLASDVPIDPEGHQTDPEGHQTDPEGHQTDPEGHQTDPEGHQTPPSMSSYLSTPTTLSGAPRPATTRPMPKTAGPDGMNSTSSPSSAARRRSTPRPPGRPNRRPRRRRPSMSTGRVQPRKVPTAPSGSPASRRRFAWPYRSPLSTVPTLALSTSSLRSLLVPLATTPAIPSPQPAESPR